MSNTPKQVAEILFMMGLCFMFMFLKNKNDESPTKTANNVFESCTKKYHNCLSNYIDRFVHTSTDSDAIIINSRLAQPHSFVFSNIFLGYILM